MSETEARGYHHVFDEPDSDHVVLTWPRTIPHARRTIAAGRTCWRSSGGCPSWRPLPVLLLWAPEDEVFPLEFGSV